MTSPAALAIRSTALSSAEETGNIAQLPVLETRWNVPAVYAKPVTGTINPEYASCRSTGTIRTKNRGWPVGHPRIYAQAELNRAIALQLTPALRSSEYPVLRQYPCHRPDQPCSSE